MLVEGTLRWQVTEGCPWDLLVALAVRDLAGLEDVGDPALPRLVPALEPVPAAAAAPAMPSSPAPARAADAAERTRRDTVAAQWLAWFRAAADRERLPRDGLLQPPHFAAFDRAVELQDVILATYDEASAWARERVHEFERSDAGRHALRVADVVDTVQQREHELHRRSGSFRLELDVLPFATSGAWIIGPHTIAVSSALRDDSAAFRQWFRPLAAALV
ncbi:MAG: hypothetical protein FWD85_11055 [Microbacteriaceae bacterium]|nr:hypothetical protein [Microbacteriaceae bacterium]